VSDDPVLDAHRLLGAWSLVAYDARAADGTVRQPLGADVVGRLHYAADGTMSALLTRRGGGGEGAIGYAGTFTLAVDAVVHHVAVSLAPRWVGTDLRRSVRLAGDDLMLGAVADGADGQPELHELRWRRLPRG